MAEIKSDPYLSTESQVKVNKVIESDPSLKALYDQVVRTIRSGYEKVRQQIGLEDSQFGKSDSWIHIDVLKQFAYLHDNSLKRGAGYIYDNPLTNVQLQQQIIDRHLGWEVLSQIQQSRLYQQAETPFVQKIKQNQAVNNFIDQNYRHNHEPHQALSSLHYAELGRILRK